MIFSLPFHTFRRRLLFSLSECCSCEMMAPIFRQDFSPLHTNIQTNIFLTENSILSGNFIKIGGRRRQRESFFEFSAHFQHWSLLTTSFWIFQINSCQIKSNRQNDSTVCVVHLLNTIRFGREKLLIQSNEPQISFEIFLNRIQFRSFYFNGYVSGISVLAAHSSGSTVTAR